jgi:hypothetical protein
MTAKKQVTVSYSALLDDRIRAIAKRLNMPIRDVLVKLIVVGLDASQDLELMERNTNV